LVASCSTCVVAAVSSTLVRPQRSTLFPYTTLFRSEAFDQTSVSKIRSTAFLVFKLSAAIEIMGILILTAWWTPVSGFLNALPEADRKSTRLNSSHVKISYAVFCLKQKNKAHTYEHE